MRRILKAGAVSTALSMALAACVSWGWFEPGDFFKIYDLPAKPKKEAAVLCHGYGCQIKTPVNLTPVWPQVRAQFANVTTPAQEREAISQSVGLVERSTGPVLGTENDEGSMINASWSGDPAHQDCVDEAANTTTLLVLMQQDGLLRHHTVEPPSIRGMFLDGRYQHYAAIIREVDTDEKYAVDSWFRSNGKPAVVMTHLDWISGYDHPQ